MSWLRRRLTYANVMSTIAVFAVLGGGAYAAQRIGPKDIRKNAVRAKHVKKNAVRSAHIRNKGVEPRDLARKTKRRLRGNRGPRGPGGPQGPAGPAGPKGDAGATNVVVRRERSATGLAPIEDVRCNAGERAVGGGGKASSSLANLELSHPLPQEVGSTPDGWRAASHADVDHTLTVYAICASP